MFALWPGDQLNFSIFIKPTFGFVGQPAASKAGHIANTNVGRKAQDEFQIYGRQKRMTDMWTPITIESLRNLILKGELELNDNQLNFWDLIKIEPEKWKEKEYGTEGGGFWVVAIFGREVIYYNDIEDGFNISTYKNYGEIEEYWCNQSDLNWTVIGLMERIKANRFS